MYMALIANQMRREEMAEERRVAENSCPNCETEMSVACRDKHRCPFFSTIVINLRSRCEKAEERREWFNCQYDEESARHLDAVKKWHCATAERDEARKWARKYGRESKRRFALYQGQIDFNIELQRKCERLEAQLSTARNDALDEAARAIHIIANSAASRTKEGYFLYGEDRILELKTK